MSTQVTVTWSVSNSRSMVESTGTINDWSSANDDTDTASTANVIRGWWRRRGDRAESWATGSPPDDGC